MLALDKQLLEKCCLFGNPYSIADLPGWCGVVRVCGERSQCPRVAGGYLQEWCQLTQKRVVHKSWPGDLLFFHKGDPSKFTL